MTQKRKPGKKAFTPSQWTRVSNYLVNHTVEEAAARFGVVPSTIWRYKKVYAARPANWKPKPSAVVTRPCGTPSAHRRHLKKGEIPCDKCRKANNAHQRKQYRLKRLAAGETYAPAKPLQPCGTPAAYARHLKNKEVPCLPCTKARTEYSVRKTREREARKNGNVINDKKRAA